MIKQGGWLLVGDSVTENHFFSLSCLLYPHKLFLSLISPLIPELDLSPDFCIESTPLVLFRRVDLLLNQEDLEQLYRTTLRTKAEEVDPTATSDTAKSLYSEEAMWFLSPSEYMPILLSPPPAGNFEPLIVNTGSHWATTLTSAFCDDEAGDGDGIEGVKAFFEVAMRTLAGQVQEAIDEYRRNGGTRPKQVVVRPYLPGHEDCMDHRKPWSGIAPFNWRWYNWPWMKDYNIIFQHPGHCPHIMTGVGVLEGRSRYIWRFVTQ